MLAVQPRPQLALLAPGECDELTGLVGLALDQRERLQHGVVQVRRHLGALFGSDALAPLLRQLARHAPDPWCEDQRQPGDRHRDGDRDLPRRRQRVVGGEERAQAGEHEHRPETEAEQRTASPRRAIRTAVPEAGWPRS